MSSGNQQNAIVIKSNALISARFDWSVLQQRAIMLLVSQLSRQTEMFDEQRIYVSDLQDLTESKAKNMHRQFVKLSSDLLSLRVEVRTDDGQSYEGYNVMSFSKYQKGSGYIEARFNPDMRPYLIQLKSHFTRYHLKQAIRLQSVYSIRLYEICKQFESIGWRTVSIKEFRRMLVLEDKYTRFTELRRRVIEPAQREIKEKCDLCFDYKVQRKGRTPTAIRFDIKPNVRVAGSATKKPTIDYSLYTNEELWKLFAVWSKSKPGRYHRLHSEAITHLREWLDKEELTDEAVSEEQLLSNPGYNQSYRRIVLSLIRETAKDEK